MVEITLLRAQGLAVTGGGGGGVRGLAGIAEGSVLPAPTPFSSPFP